MTFKGPCFHIAGVTCDNCREDLGAKSIYQYTTGTSINLGDPDKVPEWVHSAARVSQLEAEIAELKKEIERLAQVPVKWNEGCYEEGYKTATQVKDARTQKLVEALDRVLTTQEAYFKYAVEGEPGGPFTKKGEHLVYTESKLDVERRNALEAARQALATYRREAGEE